MTKSKKKHQHQLCYCKMQNRTKINSFQSKAFFSVFLVHHPARNMEPTSELGHDTNIKINLLNHFVYVQLTIIASTEAICLKLYPRIAWRALTHAIWIRITLWDKITKMCVLLTYNFIVPCISLPWELWVSFSGQSQL